MCDSSLEGDYFRNIALGLVKRGFRVSLIQLGSGDPPTWLSEVPDVQFHSLGASSLPQYLFAVRRLASLLERENVDILHTHLFYSGLIGVLSKKLRRRTLVALMRHHTSVVRMLGSAFHIRADGWMAENADHVLTVSDAARDFMRDVDGITREIDVVHLGFDFEKLSPNQDDRERIRQEFGFAPDDFVIGYVANFALGKGHIQLMEAFGNVLDEVPNAKLFLPGRGEIADVNDAAAKLPKETIVFPGWRFDVPACLNAMDIFVQPSLSEAFSQVIMEALGVGLPVIATRVGGAAEVIENGVNGILIEPDDMQQIADEVLRLCRDAEMRKRLGNAGREKVIKSFTAEQMVGRQAAIYKNWLQ